MVANSAKQQCFEITKDSKVKLGKDSFSLGGARILAACSRFSNQVPVTCQPISHKAPRSLQGEVITKFLEGCVLQKDSSKFILDLQQQNMSK